MNITDITQLYNRNKEPLLNGRYITNSHIKPLLENLEAPFEVSEIGTSVLGKPISAIKIGQGQKRILLWSQMHGNESTTTKALFDFINVLKDSSQSLAYITEVCTFYIIPILNPDGAEAYTRLNATPVDLNRDAQTLSQPESKVLRAVYNDFKPHYCFNLHGQRTIFSAGSTNKTATVSFLSPAQDENRSITDSRKIGMDIIAEMNSTLQQLIPGKVGRYDDSFNINCVGDSFQSFNVPTILFEAGHFENDYDRDITRFYIFSSYVTAFNYIATSDVSGANYNEYFKIPENDKCFYDIIIRDANVGTEENPEILDVGILFVEKLINKTIAFSAKVETIALLSKFYGHKEINANKMRVLAPHEEAVVAGAEIDFVTIGNGKFLLKL
ncbi:M14 family metallopeptidase [Formosa haliotis]|uniref:M14 family metallopeptidase n=1 Tax=Formosa haliotis TaxID=1555194 RepID=UPI000826503E|nr:M14 metallopeptidase family protein [Formosa haliotis]